MKRLAPVIVLLSYALWLGGLASLLMFVLSLNRLDKPLSLQVNPKLFQIFEPKAVICGMVCFWATAFWALRSWSRHVLLMLVFIGVALSAMLLSYGVVTPNVLSSLRGSSEFWKWHGLSNVAYLTQVFMLFMTGLAFPGAIRSTMLPLLRRTNSEAAPVSAPLDGADRPTT